jgi:hypothetical protein
VARHRETPVSAVDRKNRGRRRRSPRWLLLGLAPHNHQAPRLPIRVTAGEGGTRRKRHSHPSSLQS